MALAYAIPVEDTEQDPGVQAAERIGDFLRARNWDRNAAGTGLSGSAEDSASVTSELEQLEPEGILGRALYRSGLEELRLPAIRRDFQSCFAARTEAQREARFASLLRHRDAESVLRVALEEFDQHGNDDRIVLAAVVLDALGRQSIPALQKLASKNSPEAEYFVETAVNLARRHRDATDAQQILYQLAFNPSEEVRERLADSLVDVRIEVAAPILSVLRQDSCEEVAAAAEDSLSELDIG